MDGGSLQSGPSPIEVALPLSIVMGKKKIKRFYLNMNVYRNLYYQTSNKLKEEFGVLVSPSLVGVPPLSKITLLYTLYLPTKRRADLMNAVVVVDKFFCDVLVKCGVILDDCIGILDKITIKFGGYDKTNPRVVATIFPV